MKPAALQCRKRPRETQGSLYLYKQLQALDGHDHFQVDVDDSDITNWNCSIDADSLRAFGMTSLAQDLIVWHKRYRTDDKPAALVLQLSFPRDHPYSPPFVRIVRPRFHFHTGHVTIGGSICTAMLTSSGWRPMIVEALLHSICATLMEGNARVQLTRTVHCPCPSDDYTLAEAQEAFARVAGQHGWL